MKVTSRLSMEPYHFTQVAVAALRKLYPEQLADSSFDNTGLLVEAPDRPKNRQKLVLLTTDLTSAVADEAINRRSSLIVAYHPIIFRPLKALSLQDTQQKTILRLVQEGISVYSPHTAVDAAPGGLNDWLADIVTGEETEVVTSPSTRTIIKPTKNAPPPGFEGAGYGRIVRFDTPQALGSIVKRITKGLKAQNGLSVAVPQSTLPNLKSQIPITTVGICAGSGGSILNGLDVDLLFTGELSHHEALAAIEANRAVITAGHSNTERIFLEKRLKDRLIDGILQELDLIVPPVDRIQDIVVIASMVDRDPYEIVRLEDKDWK
ncbi:unnamed protein product [Blumeria hordei]|uniref:Uncharacterized protein n=2 Tax=Blumeria hordei TaxID=2867405 RepID=A0A383UWQ4_BLUHO|nr:NGG1 interacting factor 3 [Blumeria hordei DH14]SZF03790.1 unnamed protein product [Blumeria hordei]